VKRVLKYGILAFSILIILLVGFAALLWHVWSSNLPYIGSLKDYYPPIITEVYSDDGQLIGRFWKEKRIIMPLDQIPDQVKKAFIAAEDARFFQHEGVDISSIIRAFLKNLMAGRIEQGGSTITQQVTKSLLLKDPEKTYRRKVREAILSLQIERNFTKDQILFLYLNQIYLGHGAYGVEAAARTYFKKGVAELNLAEAALLAGLPQAPSKYSLITSFDKAKARQKYVLEQMRQEGYISKEQEQEAYQAEVQVNHEAENYFEAAPSFTEYIRRYLEQKYGEELLYKGGLKVYTTVNLKFQQAGQEALKAGLRELDKREGYRGPLQRLKPEEIEDYKQKLREKWELNPPTKNAVIEGVIEKVDDAKKEVVVALGAERLGLLPFSEMRWARKPDPETPSIFGLIKNPSEALKQGDVILVALKEEGPLPYAWRVSLEQEPDVQGAIFCMEADTGKVKAMIGGRDFSISQFDRATQARRQPGSAFKPLIYSAALDWGMSPATVLLDSPYMSSVDPNEEEIWKPKNYGEKFYGPTLFRTALVQSRNVITVKILNKIGVNYVIEYARKMGIESDLAPDLSLALGSSGVSLKELTRAYGIFASGGLLAEPLFIIRVEDRTGKVLEENHPSLKEVLSKQTTYIMTDILKAVVQEGTGFKAKVLKRPVAGKTGTTNDLRDAWFVGFSPDLVAGVWVGYDDRRPMSKGETGAVAASPIWVNFMAEVLKNKPVQDFPIPEGVVFAKIDERTGLLASPSSEKTIFQAFREGEEPSTYSPPPKAADSKSFTEFDLNNLEE
jgi:penicillin-binding protein 1A